MGVAGVVSGGAQSDERREASLGPSDELIGAAGAPSCNRINLLTEVWQSLRRDLREGVRLAQAWRAAACARCIDCLGVGGATRVLCSNQSAVLSAIRAGRLGITDLASVSMSSASMSSDDSEARLRLRPSRCLEALSDSLSTPASRNIPGCGMCILSPGVCVRVCRHTASPAAPLGACGEEAGGLGDSAASREHATGERRMV
mmetsp:Transcript_12741/g.29914  ORF Transcript_12741/g.29914 Transcript_12741/m.29914 type:complete len:202 (-) Transcript_12741:517-1122(-)